MPAPEGRVIMISGANRGIGHAIALCLLDKGYSLYQRALIRTHEPIGAFRWT